MFNYDDHSELEIDTYAIGGKMITASVSITEEQLSYLDTVKGGRDEVRWRLVRTIAEAMLENKLVEITSEDVRSSTTYEMDKIIRARAYVCPDGMTKLLRTLRKQGRI